MKHRKFYSILLSSLLPIFLTSCVVKSGGTKPSNTPSTSSTPSTPSTPSDPSDPSDPTGGGDSGGGGGSTGPSTPTSFSEEVLSADKDGYYFNLLGGFYPYWTPSNYNQMRATSISNVASFNQTVGQYLSNKDVQYLYIIDNIRFGEGIFDITNNWERISDSSDWCVPFVNENGVKMNADGSYCFKPVLTYYDEFEGEYVVQDWIPDPDNVTVEALTDNLYLPPWQKDPDEYGMTWYDNLVVTSGAGTYTVVVAKYNKVSSEETDYAIGLFQSSGSDMNPYTVYEEDEHIAIESASLYGFPFDMNFVDLEKVNDSYFQIENLFISGSSFFNVVLNHDNNNLWYGYDYVEESSRYLTNPNEGGSIAMAESAYYDVAVTVTGGTSFPSVSVSFAKVGEPDPASKYQIVINGVHYNTTANPTPLDPSYDEYYALGISCKYGDQLLCYDSVNDSTWSIPTLDQASQGFTQTTAGIYCTQDGKYDFYLKFKFQEDQVYIGKSS